MMLTHPYLSVGLKRNRHPNERMAISKLNHTRNMTESENTLAEEKTPVKHGPNFVDRTGQRIGNLVIQKLAKKDKYGHSHWECLCDCGNKKIAAWSSLCDGIPSSCGCQTSKVRSEARITHGRTNSSEYAIWRGIKRRCYNPKNEAFSDYGGRGITMCERWLTSFENFFEDMGERPHGLSINRKNNDGNYEPENCEWATTKEQQNNRRSNRLIEFNGRTQTMSEWATEIGLKHCTLWRRFHNGWSIEKCLTEKLNKRKHE